MQSVNCCVYTIDVFRSSNIFFLLLLKRKSEINNFSALVNNLAVLIKESYHSTSVLFSLYEYVITLKRGGKNHNARNVCIQHMYLFRICTNI